MGRADYIHLTSGFFLGLVLALGGGLLQPRSAAAERAGSYEWIAAGVDGAGAEGLPACREGIYEHDTELSQVDCTGVTCPERPPAEELLLCPVGVPQPTPGCPTIRIHCGEMPDRIAMCCDGEGGIEMREEDCRRLGLANGLYCAGCIQQVGEDRIFPKPSDDLDEVLEVIISRCTVSHEWGHINDELVRPGIESWQTEQLSFQRGAECFRDFYEAHCRNRPDPTPEWVDFCLSLEAHSCDSTLAESVNACIGSKRRGDTASVPGCRECGEEPHCSARRCLGENNPEVVRQICRSHVDFYCLQQWRKRLWTDITIPAGFDGACLQRFLEEQEPCLSEPDRSACRNACREALEGCRTCSPVDRGERDEVREYIESVCDPFSTR